MVYRVEAGLSQKTYERKSKSFEMWAQKRTVIRIRYTQKNDNRENEEGKETCNVKFV